MQGRVVSLFDHDTGTWNPHYPVSTCSVQKKKCGMSDANSATKGRTVVTRMMVRNVAVTTF